MSGDNRLEIEYQMPTGGRFKAVGDNADEVHSLARRLIEADAEIAHKKLSSAFWQNFISVVPAIIGLCIVGWLFYLAVDRAPSTPSRTSTFQFRSVN